MLLKRLRSYGWRAVTIGNHRPYSSTSKKLVVVQKIKGTTTIGINRPEKRNCVNFEVADELSKALTDFENDPEAKVGVLYGIGGNFCAGWDLSEISPENVDKLRIDQLPPGNGFMGPTRRFFSKPTIAAVTGYAVAGGLELALMCDMRIAEEDTVMGAYCRRFGVPLIDGGTVRLPHLIGLSRAMDMIITGRGVRGKEAYEIGLANRLVAVGTAIGQAVHLSYAIEQFPQQCLNIDRMSANYAMYSAKSFQEAIENELKKGSEVLKTESVDGAALFAKGTGRHGSFNYNLNGFTGEYTINVECDVDSFTEKSTS